MKQIYLAVGSVTGTATAVAERVALELKDLGHEVQLDSQASVAALTQQDFDAILVVTATTGQGDIPDNLLPFYAELGDTMPLQTGKPFGVIALGDSSYMNFCGAGEKMEERLYELQAVAPVPKVTIDATETVTPDDDAVFWLKEWSAAALA
ncbi:flavodoxin [Bacterioplanes sanyensis]|uniref:flavodoxin domain-containing protein n=1 Tax=Bacterioplanes sanyensis TaxID=1249553 RepID=UPI001674AD36|nr:flavodoxin domain-containing protein [Bacterioplanes sanyensis]GGY38400.1 flavodoxin [Bacterioplanes sanyensis]